MKHEFSTDDPIRFSDGGIFVATCTIDIDRRIAHWRVPRILRDRFPDWIAPIDETNTFDTVLLKGIARRMCNDLLLPEETIDWRSAVGYRYARAESPASSPSGILTKGNNALPAVLVRDRWARWYEESEFAVCRVEDNEVVSIAFSENSAVTIMTKPAYRRRGYAKACLGRWVDVLLEHGLVPLFATEQDNLAARTTAESLGFEASDYVYWLSVAARRAVSASKQSLERLGVREVR